MKHKWTEDCDGQIYCKRCGDYLEIKHPEGELIITECKEKEQ